MGSDWIEFEIINWEKYNPRADRKGHTWFRMENTIATEQKFFRMSPAHRYVAICLFAEYSKNKGERSRINVSWFADLLDVKASLIHETFQQLVTNGVLRLPAVSGGNQSADTDGRTDGRTVSATAPSAPALPHLAELWNKHRGKLPEVRGCSGTRKRQAESRWREKPDPDYWREVIARIVTSPFCSGENDRGWRADFDFLVKPETQHRAREGKYDARGGPGSINTTPIRLEDVL